MGPDCRIGISYLKVEVSKGDRIDYENEDGDEDEWFVLVGAFLTTPGTRWGPNWRFLLLSSGSFSGCGKISFCPGYDMTISLADAFPFCVAFVARSMETSSPD